MLNTPRAPSPLTRDAETGLPDRAALEGAAVDLVAGGDPRPVFVAAFGVDRFDRLRAALGYDHTARLLAAIAARLAGRQAHWRVARASPGVIAAAFHAPDATAALAAVEAARRDLEIPHAVNEHWIDVRLTAGVSAGGPPQALVRQADLALDAARAAARRCGVFDPAAHASASATLALMPELRAAIAADRLSLAHQPKFDLRRGGLAGVECLVRWTHPRHGAIAPDLFIPMAEETGDIRALTEWVLRRAVAEQAALAAAGFDVPFAVNLSGALVDDAGFIDLVLTIAHTAAGELRLEVTETALIARPDAAITQLRRLADAGVPCSIDDYGSGLSSLSYLKQIDADELKLDKSLVKDVARSKRDALLVRSTIDLAHALGMRVVGEGVEDGATAAVLASMGCDYGQGYHLARPAPYAELLAELRRRGREAGAGPRPPAPTVSAA